ncbi:hypothetical protein [Blastococcus saxobsidens]|uniref:Uncharacterized protein n=1 Tax=Blastococcus saxobsidens TaxID=138336 RepID=A0A4V2G1Z5_9ACTN|nr:hypothetical protein [Blastococcus saxobsidens]RZU31156.1 hypothetical protein BKA19_0804 [Blastococcus saxobsidens]
MKGAVGAAAGLFAFSQISAGFFSLTGAASDLQGTLSKSGAIFGSNAAAIDQWAKSAATSLGLSRQQALAAAAGFGDMFSQIGFAGDQAADMSKAVVQMSADLGAFNDLPTEDVADRISAAFRGEYDSLQALIPNINAARVESEAMAATGKKVASELTAQEKAAAVLAIVNKDGARAIGAFAREADSAAGSAKTASALWLDQKAAIGEQLLPAFTTLMGFLSGTVIPGVGDLADFIGDDVVPAFKDMAQWVEGNKDPLLVLTGIIGGYVAVVKTVAGAKRGWAAAQAALNLVMAANPITLVVVAIAALAAGLVYAYQNSETFRDIVNGAFDAVKRGVGNAIGFMIDGFRMILTVWLTVADGIVSGAATALGWVPEVGDKLKAANTAFDNFKDGVLADLDEAAQSAYGFGEKTGKNAAGGMSATQQAAWNAARAVGGQMASGVGAAGGGAYSSGYGVGANAGQGAVDGLNAKRDAVVRAARAVAGALSAAMGKKLDINSPSRVTRWMGEMVGEGFIEGMAHMRPAVAAEMGRMASFPAPAAIRLPAPVGMSFAGAAAEPTGGGMSGGPGGFDSMVRADTINIIEGTADDVARKLNLELRSRGN